MKKGYKTVSQKVVSIFMAFMFIALTAPFVFAAESLTATKSVSKWPTLSYKTENKKIYYGQTLGETLIINDDEVVLDSNGNQVAGHFEFLDAKIIPTPSESTKANIKFVPDDTDKYTGFTKRFCADVTYSVETGVLEPVNHDTEPLVATDVESGAELSTSVLSGGKYTNPYNPNEPKLLARTWEWLDPSTTVVSSDYYDAVFRPAGYEPITTKVYVRLAGETPETTIVEKPTLPELTYDGVTTWDQIELIGGKASLLIEGTDVEGTFSIDKNLNGKVITPGNFTITIYFTPADPEAATSTSFKLSGTVNKATVKFVDESGNEIVPEIILDRSLNVGSDLDGYLKQYTNVPCSFNFEETEGYGTLLPVGTKEYTVKTIIDDPNYERYNTLKFKLTVNQEKKTADVKDVVGGKSIYIEGGDVYKLNGTFDVNYIITEIGSEKVLDSGKLSGIKLNEKFTVPETKSGVYSYEVVYNGTADDHYAITVNAPANKEVKLKHNVIVNGIPVEYTYGDDVDITAPANEKPYYVFAGWGNSSYIPEGESANETVSFIMPDGDVELQANYEFSHKALFEYIFSLIVDFFRQVAEALQFQNIADFFKGIFAA